jgi:hypothetical protein
MYFLDTISGPIVCPEPQAFTNSAGTLVGLDIFAADAETRIASGIWPMESDDLPTGNVVVTGSTYERRENVIVRHWVTRPMTASELATSQQQAAAQAAAITETDIIFAVQHMLDAKARERNYDGILSACSYATSTVSKFKNEALACVAWRDAVWAQCYASLAAVQAGHMAPPSKDEFVASLPQLTWPS